MVPGVGIWPCQLNLTNHFPDVGKMGKFYMKINKPLIDFLLWCLKNSQKEGSYYGDKKQFDKRMADATQLLISLRDTFE